ncbi:unnamed protein product [Sphenostylis stenocarpa]|uniref:Uncharacterized protein n=1 Tax=Sphenostylis stenocarpa TaxID=92480 RepID=A0AA86VVJ8_9FABA|nr:unnamed protein product [Sphenostylis stenocarpa]
MSGDWVLCLRNQRHGLVGTLGMAHTSRVNFVVLNNVHIKQVNNGHQITFLTPN